MAAEIKTDTLTFYDVHCHTMNLSHPCLYAFIKRFLPMLPGGLLVAGPIAGPVAAYVWMKKRGKVFNLLSVLERTVGRTLMAMEDDLPDLKIGDRQFDSYIVNPLLMDF